ncbi:MAG: PqqD family peptide modification chaperone [Candidatus Tectomicrobia bacterium]|uniref:PqqD family peptide modification chaperone n=1 Tax=Tectimicrobiota bacterium TaxID=2528274 RepID=A0A932CNA9_UNCTE|nr:PqqD family peptide modification chaperone [Candidatus Tectomicrobia bacterium]
MRANRVIPLREDLWLVRGARNSALYDLSESRIHPLEPIWAADAADSDGAGGPALGRPSLAPLGTSRPGPAVLVVPRPENRPPPGPGIFPGKRARTVLRFLWLELTSRCNLQCLHCYGSSGPSVQTRELATADWKRVIREAASLGCQALQFTGGEPLLHPEIRDLIGYAREQGYRFLEVFTNATLLGPREIAFFAEHRVHLAVSFYSHRAAVHDRITQVRGSFRATTAHLKALVREEIPFRVAVIAMRENQAEVEETLRFLQGLGIEEDQIGTDEVRPTGRGRASQQAPDPPLTFGPPAGGDWRGCPDPCEGNRCWPGKLCVTSAGRVIPCIFARDLLVGDLRRSSLGAILDGEPLQTLWGITLDKVEGCQDCEYRYACRDCRALPYTHTGNLYARSPRCRYDPYRPAPATPSGPPDVEPNLPTPTADPGRIMGEPGPLEKEPIASRRPAEALSPQRGGQRANQAHPPMKPMPERPLRRASILTRILEGEGILYDPATHSVHALNPMAALIWELCDGEHTPAEIGELLGEIFEAEREEIATDVQEALRRLQELDLLEEEVGG